eukprot:scaffold4686_cov53-Attheya_sp.AAC.1
MVDLSIVPYAMDHDSSSTWKMVDGPSFVVVNSMKKQTCPFLAVSHVLPMKFIGGTHGPRQNPPSRKKKK